MVNHRYGFFLRASVAIDDTLRAEAEAGNRARRLVAIRQDSSAWGDGRTEGQRILSADAIPSLQM
jgi:hypothetical protein